MPTISKVNLHNMPTKLWNAESSRMTPVWKIRRIATSTPSESVVYQEWMDRKLLRLLLASFLLLFATTGHPLS
jgi:hypothetical protein